MSTELKYLAFTALLTASLWIPYVIAQVKTNGFLIPENYVDPKQRPLPFWGQRADRAYLNAVETGVAHAVVYLAGWPYIRTLIFVLGWICIVGLFVELVK